MRNDRIEADRCHRHMILLLRMDSFPSILFWSLVLSLAEYAVVGRVMAGRAWHMHGITCAGWAGALLSYKSHLAAPLCIHTLSQSRSRFIDYRLSELRHIAYNSLFFRGRANWTTSARLALGELSILTSNLVKPHLPYAREIGEVQGPKLPCCGSGAFVGPEIQLQLD